MRWNVTIAARRMEQARQLAESVAGYRLHVTGYSDLQLSTFDLLVNSTPVGMSPNVDASPLPDDVSLPSKISIYDLIYNPRETKLVRDAKAQSCHATTGLGMLIEQAALAFQLWMDHTPPREVLWNAVEN